MTRTDKIELTKAVLEEHKRFIHEHHIDIKCCDCKICSTLHELKENPDG